MNVKPNNQYLNDVDALDQRDLGNIIDRIGVNEHLIVFLGNPQDSKTQRIVHILAQAVNQLNMKQDVFYVDVTKQLQDVENFMVQYHFNPLPSLVVFNNGELDAKYQGNGGKPEIISFLKAHR